MSSDEAPLGGGTLEEEFDEIERAQAEAVDLEHKEHELGELQRQARALADELRGARNARRRRCAEAALPVIHPRSPCAAAWDDMAGNDRVRACGRCKARVYDLGGLDTSAARRILRDHEGHLPTHVVGRGDGTVTVSTCADRRRRWSPGTLGLAAAGGIALLAGGATAGFALGSQRQAPPPAIAAVARNEQALQPVEVQALVEALAEARVAQITAETAKTRAETKPAPPPPAEKREKRHRKPCRGWGMGLHHNSWSMPDLYYFEEDEGCGGDD